MSRSPMRDRIAGRVDRTARRIIDHAQRTNTPLAELASVRVPWMSTRSASQTGDTRQAEVLIYDEIGGSAGVQADQFAEEIAAVEADVIKVRINSPGGSMFDGLAIFNALNHHSARIETYVDGLAASAASVIAMAGDRIVMMPGAQMMIHDASMVTDGNAADMSRSATLLQRWSDNIAELYAQRGGGEVSLWRQMMLDETWMFAGEAVQLGLADHAEVGPSAEKAALDEGATRAFDLSRFGYRYEGRENAPAPTMTIRIRPHATTQVRERSATETSPPPAIAPARRAGPAERSVPFEMAPSADGLTLEGYAAVYNTAARIEDRQGAFDEVILPGAFDDALAAHMPVLMFEHGRHPLIGTMPLGVITRTASDSTGLHIVARLSDNWLIQPVRDAVRDRAVTGMSFRFDADGGDKWQARSGNVDLRTIYQFAAVPELGPVVFPAYEPTTATVRSLAERLPDLAGRPDTRRVGGSDAPTAQPAERGLTIRQSLDDGALRARGLIK